MTAVSGIQATTLFDVSLLISIRVWMIIYYEGIWRT